MSKQIQSFARDPEDFTEFVHLKIVDFNPRPEHLDLEAYCKLFHNGFPILELPDREVDEYLIQFRNSDDIIKIEVWANDDQEKVIFIGAVSIAMSFWNCIESGQVRQQIIYLEPRNDLILTEDDYGYQCLEEANLKIAFRSFDSMNDRSLRKIINTMDQTSMRSFDDYLATDQKTNSHFTPNRLGRNDFNTSKHVKFIDFHADNSKKLRRKMENTQALPSKHSLLTNPAEEIEFQNYDRGGNSMIHHSPDENFTPVSLGRKSPARVHDKTTIEIVEESLNTTEDEMISNIARASATKTSAARASAERASTTTSQITPQEKLVRSIENEHEVQKNLHKITLSFAQSVEDYQNDTEDILKQLGELEKKQDKFSKNCQLHKAVYLGMSKGEVLLPEIERGFQEANSENLIDIRDLEDLKKHKERELDKLEKHLDDTKMVNFKLKKELTEKLPNNDVEVYQSTREVSKRNRDALQPIMGENEMMKIKLEGLQQKRRDIIFDLLSSNQLPHGFEDLINKLNEETERNLFLKKNALELEITVQALQESYNGQKEYLENLTELYGNYEKLLEETGLQIGRDLLDVIAENEKLDPQVYKDQLELERQKIPTDYSISPSKFNDKYALEDKIITLSSKIKSEFKSQSYLTPPIDEISIDLEVEETLPESVKSILEKLSEVNSQIHLAKTSLEKVTREKLIVENKKKLTRAQSSDLKTLNNLYTNVLKSKSEVDTEHFSTAERISAKEDQIFKQELELKNLNKISKELKLKLETLNAKDDDDFTEEYARLREILDILNRRIENLKKFHIKSDQELYVKKQILEDKKLKIEELKEQVKNLPKNPSRSTSRDGSKTIQTTILSTNSKLTRSSQRAPPNPPLPPKEDSIHLKKVTYNPHRTPHATPVTPTPHSSLKSN
ncbi:unnamed protein product [Moneuplotes crassus]|uniref:Uncharacterized protein n=1 Tax=Euplotes crassus TaxID=5936 RepID=A0AAD2D8A1_EUPCR|nr:unnamed protein product [Moneuplotes crassus]